MNSLTSIKLSSVRVSPMKKKKQVQQRGKLALEVFFGCREKNIELSVEWRPRNHYLLEHADHGSKSLDSSSFSLDFESYAAMLSYFGPRVEHKFCLQHGCDLCS